MFCRVRVIFCLAVSSVALAHATNAEYVPDVIEFDGTSGVAFASQPILSLPDGGTLEFWVSADWSETLGYDPVVLTNASQRAIAYQVAVGGDRQSISVQSGDKLGRLEHDFSDGAMHHVAIIDLGDETLVLVDGSPIGSLDMSLEELPTDRLRVGADYYNRNAFTGAVAALRIWDLPLDADLVASFALKDVTAEDTAHPVIDFLVGHSRFSDDDFFITEAIVVSAEELEGAAE